MEKPIFSDEFKRDVVAQITERGYPIAEISQRLGAHPPYAWKGQLAKALSSDASGGMAAQTKVAGADPLGLKFTVH